MVTFGHRKLVCCCFFSASRRACASFVSRFNFKRDFSVSFTEEVIDKVFAKQSVTCCLKLVVDELVGGGCNLGRFNIRYDPIERYFCELPCILRGKSVPHVGEVLQVRMWARMECSMVVKCTGDLEYMPCVRSTPELKVALRATVSRDEAITDDACLKEVARDQKFIVSKAGGPAALAELPVKEVGEGILRTARNRVGSKAALVKGVKELLLEYESHEGESRPQNERRTLWGQAYNSTAY